MSTNSTEELDKKSDMQVEDLTANLSMLQQILAGSQMLFVAFGALVLMPLITRLGRQCRSVYSGYWYANFFNWSPKDRYRYF